jgi:hypothetical protein
LLGADWRPNPDTATPIVRITGVDDDEVWKVQFQWASLGFEASRIEQSELVGVRLRDRPLGGAGLRLVQSEAIEVYLLILAPAVDMDPELATGYHQRASRPGGSPAGQLLERLLQLKPGVAVDRDGERDAVIAHRFVIALGVLVVDTTQDLDSDIGQIGERRRKGLSHG